MTRSVTLLSAYSLCDGLLVVGGRVDDLVTLLPEDVQHAVVPQEVAYQWRHNKGRTKVITGREGRLRFLLFK